MGRKVYALLSHREPAVILLNAGVPGLNGLQTSATSGVAFPAHALSW